jgi:hypothetical protein
MGFIVIIPLGALAGWAIVRIFLWLKGGDFGREWWRAFRLLALAGGGLGVWFAFFMRYQVANVRMVGFPVPVGISSRENPEAPWVQSQMPAMVREGARVADLMSGVALCLAPIALAAFFKENRGQKDFAGPPGAR